MKLRRGRKGKSSINSEAASACNTYGLYEPPLVRAMTDLSQGTLLIGKNQGAYQMANFLPIEKKVMVLSALVEGNSVRSIVRMTGVNKRTILRILSEEGEKAREIMNREMTNLRVMNLQV